MLWCVVKCSEVVWCDVNRHWVPLRCNPPASPCSPFSPISPFSPFSPGFCSREENKTQDNKSFILSPISSSLNRKCSSVLARNDLKPWQGFQPVFKLVQKNPLLLMCNSWVRSPHFTLPAFRLSRLPSPLTYICLPPSPWFLRSILWPQLHHFAGRPRWARHARFSFLTCCSLDSRDSWFTWLSILPLWALGARPSWSYTHTKA